MSGAVMIQAEALGRRVAVAVDDPALRESVGGLFPAYLVDAPPPTNRGPAHIQVSTEAGGYTVRGQSGAVHRCGTLVEALCTCEFTVTSAFLAGCSPLLPLHASGAVVRVRAVLALGRAGAGKSSLAVRWHRSGYPGLGDDVVLVRADARAHPFKRLYETDAELLPVIGLDPAETVFWVPGSTEAWYDPGVGAGWGEPVPAAVVAAVRHRQGASLAIRPLSTAATLNVLMHSLMDSVADRAGAVGALTRVARVVDGFEVTFGSAVEAATALAARVP